MSGGGAGAHAGRLPVLGVFLHLSRGGPLSVLSRGLRLPLFCLGAVLRGGGAFCCRCRWKLVAADGNLVKKRLLLLLLLLLPKLSVCLSVCLSI